MRDCLREIEISDNQEEKAAADEDVIIVLFDIGKSAGPRLGDCKSVDALVACAMGPSPSTPNVQQRCNLLPTFTIK